MKITLCAVLLLGLAATSSAHVLVLQTGKTMRIKSYTVDGTNIEVQMNSRSEMVIPLDWVKEIRYEADPPPEPEPVFANSEPKAAPAQSFAYSDEVLSASEKHKLDWRLVTAVMKVESNFNPKAVSPKGALGLMQLMPDTAKLYRVRNPYDPEQNIEAGVKHLKKLMKRYNNKLELVLAAYNSGEGAVDRFDGIPPFAETQQYVKKVMNLYRAGL